MFEYLAPALRVLENLHIKYEINPMCTVFETKNIDEALDIVREVHEAIFKKQVKRVITSVRIDDRRDVNRNMEEKREALHRTLKRKARNNIKK